MRVSIHAIDPIAEHGLSAYLADDSGVTICSAEADVRLIAADRLTPKVIADLRRSAEESRTPAVLVSAETAESSLTVVAARCHVSVVINRGTATRQRVLDGVKIAARGGGAMPPRVLGALLESASALLGGASAGAVPADQGLTAREVAVLRRLAEGWNSTLIADDLGFSDSTAKKVVQGVVQRLRLRNRTHAVAYAIRRGLI